MCDELPSAKSLRIKTEKSQTEAINIRFVCVCLCVCCRFDDFDDAIDEAIEEDIRDLCGGEGGDLMLLIYTL